MSKNVIFLKFDTYTRNDSIGVFLVKTWSKTFRGQERSTRKNIDEKTLLNALHLPAFSSERHIMALVVLKD